MSVGLSKTDVIFEINYNPNFVPYHGREVNVKTMTVYNEELRVMKNHATGAAYMLDELTYQVWLLIDGKRTVAEIRDEASRKWSDVTPKNVIQSLVGLAEEGLLRSQLEPETKKRINVMSAFRVEVSLIKDSKAFIASIHRKIKPMLATSLLWASILFILVACFLFAETFATIFAERSNFEIFGSSVVGFFFYYFVVLFPVIALHELSHGLALVHYGGSPGEIGTGLLYFGPIFYIEVGDAWTLNRRGRIIVYMAGNLSTLLVGAAIFFVNFLWNFSSSVSHFLSMTAFFCFYMTLWNLVPTFETDGYYALADLLNTPDLRHDSTDYVKHLVRRIFGRSRKKDQEALEPGKKVTLLMYAVVASVLFIYLAYQTLLITIYMSGDVVVFAYDLASMIMLAQPFSVVLVIVGVLTIVYFGMSMIGYGVILVSAINKAKVRNLQLEVVHDRDLSSFHYLPPEVPRSLVESLMGKLRKTARRFSTKFEVQRRGSLCTVELRLGGTKWAIAEVKSRIREMERAFSSTYQNFLKQHEQKILTAIGIYSPKKAKLTNFLKKLADEASDAHMPEAKTLVEQLIKQECRTTLYLLNSVMGTVCTIELPPDLLEKYQKTLLPTFFVRDLAATDLYDEVEDFKKQVIYGFDSLAALAAETRRSVRESLAHPEKYQVGSSFEPIRGLLLFVGRTEEMEGRIDDFGPLFVCQVWYGYMDRILSDTNLTLSSLGQLTSLRKKQLAALKDGETTLIRKNLSILLENESLVNELVEKSESHFQSAIRNMKELERHLKPTSAYRVGLINSICAVNKENMRKLPSRLRKFKTLYRELCHRLRRAHEQVLREHERRKVAFLRRKRRLLTIYPLVAALSVFLAVTALLWIPTSYVTVSMLAGAVMLQGLYWIIYFFLHKSFNTVGRYSSPEFDQIHLYILASVEAVQKFVANADVLNPTEALIQP